MDDAAPTPTSDSRRRALAGVVGAAIAVVVLLALAGCGSSDGGAASRLVAPAEFGEAVAQAGTVTINVHIPDEGSIEGTDLWIPFDAVEAHADELPPPTTPLAVYCRSGNMSATAVETLTRLGYDDIVELDGGMVEWTNSGLLLQPARGS